MINPIHAVILGAVQGIAEFLPISSSGHLILTERFLHAQAGLTFDAIMHLATAIAIVAYFWKDLWQYALAFINTVFTRKIKTHEEKMAWFIFLGSIPAMILGLLLEKSAETVFRSPILVASTLIIFGLILAYAEKQSKKQSDLKKLNLIDVIIIGLAQAIALVPGVSRSGITMTAGLFRGLTREAAARFSFLLSAPIIVGAGSLKLLKLFKDTQALLDPGLWIGFVTAFVTGFLAIGFLLNFIKKHSFNVFVWYRIVMGLAIILIFTLH